MNEQEIIFIEKALKEWKLLLGDRAVLTDLSELERYKANTISIERIIPAVIKVRDFRKISTILKIANQYKIPLYPISTGKNWGYGSANPVNDNCVVLDLSELTKILDFNEELGYVTLEPGVTQAMLYDYLQKNQLDFLVPTTGAGPSCSILGNAVERGYGITPFADHFSSLISLEAVLPNGSVYQSPLNQFGAYNVSNLHKWGVGPYMDGIFTQSNFGIVTKITIALAKRKEALEIFRVSIDTKEKLEEIIPLVRELKQNLGDVLGGINLMNAERMGGMFSDKDFPLWTSVGALYGSSGLVKEAKKIVRKKLKSLNLSVTFVNQHKINSLKKAQKILPNFLLKHFTGIAEQIYATQQLFDVLNGIPSQIALPLAYLKSKHTPDINGEMNPALDGCGLIWFSPLVPIRAEIVTIYIKNVYEICQRHQIDPLVTLTTVSNVCFDSTIPILFDKENGQAQAKKCYQELMQMAHDIGIMPYRINVDSMKIYQENQHLTSVQLIHQIKQVLDPNNILAPGRYNS